MDGTVAFYDGLAADYHLVYGDRWDEAVDRQGAALDRLIERCAPDARTVLDCSCGIGTQAIGLARRGWTVTGTDPSSTALDRARAEAARLGVALDLGVADFRDLTGVTGGPFDVVLSADNAVPHMESDSEVRAALRGMHGAVARGGLLVVSTRDYDAALQERPPAPPPIDVPGPPRRLVVRLQDWDGPEGRMHTTRFLVLTERGDGWDVREHRVRYRALLADELAEAARAAGFVDVVWHAAAAVGFHQPVMTARRPS